MGTKCGKSNQRAVAMTQTNDQKKNAERALNEADERRKANEATAKPAPTEKGGRKGPDPARYGDWEVKGLASDF